MECIIPKALWCIVYCIIYFSTGTGLSVSCLKLLISFINGYYRISDWTALHNYCTKDFFPSYPKPSSKQRMYIRSDSCVALMILLFILRRRRASTFQNGLPLIEVAVFSFSKTGWLFLKQALRWNVGCWCFFVKGGWGLQSPDLGEKNVLRQWENRMET